MKYPSGLTYAFSSMFILMSSCAILSMKKEEDNSYPYRLFTIIKNFGPTRIINFLPLSGNQCLLTASETVLLYNIDTGKKLNLETLGLSYCSPSSTVFDADNPLLIMPASDKNSKNMTVFWKLSDPEKFYRLPVNSNYTVATRDTLFTGTLKGDVTAWDAETQKPKCSVKIKGDDLGITQMNVNNVSHSLAVYAGTTLQLYDIRSAKITFQAYCLKKLLALANTLDYSPDGSTIALTCQSLKTGTRDIHMILVDSKTGKLREKKIEGMEFDAVDGFTNTPFLKKDCFFGPCRPVNKGIMKCDLDDLSKPLIPLTSVTTDCKRIDSISISPDEEAVYFSSAPDFDEYALYVYKKNKTLTDLP